MFLSGRIPFTLVPTVVRQSYPTPSQKLHIKDRRPQLCELAISTPVRRYKQFSRSVCTPTKSTIVQSFIKADGGEGTLICKKPLIFCTFCSQIIGKNLISFRHRQRADYDNRSSRCFNLLERCIYVIRLPQVVSFRYQAGTACAPNGAACSLKHPAVLYRVLWAKWFATGSRRLSKHPACYTGLRCAPSGSGYLCSQWGRVLLQAPCCVIPCSLGPIVFHSLPELIYASRILHWAPMCSLWLRVPVLPMGPRAPASTLLCYTVFFRPNGLQRAPGGYLSTPHATLGSGVLPLAPGTCAPNGATCS